MGKLERFLAAAAAGFFAAHAPDAKAQETVAPPQADRSMQAIEGISFEDNDPAVLLERASRRYVGSVMSREAKERDIPLNLPGADVPFDELNLTVRIPGTRAGFGIVDGGHRTGVGIQVPYRGEDDTTPKERKH